MITSETNTFLMIGASNHFGQRPSTKFADSVRGASTDKVRLFSVEGVRSAHNRRCVSLKQYMDTQLQGALTRHSTELSHQLPALMPCKAGSWIL